MKHTGFVSSGLLALVAVALAACEQAPPTRSFAATAADKSVETRLRQPDPMQPLQPFDEQFVVVDRSDGS